MSAGSITHWIAGLRAGQSEAARQIWERYFARLVQMAGGRLRGLPRAAADEEDLVLSAFDSFCRGAQQGRFPRLDDRDDLWQVLFVITQRKIVDHLHHAGAGKRDWRKTASADDDRLALADMDGREPDPAFAVEVAEQCQRLLGLLRDDLRVVAIRKMEGYTNNEIALLVKCSVATVERKLDVIRREWKAAGLGHS